MEDAKDSEEETKDIPFVEEIVPGSETTIIINNLHSYSADADEVKITPQFEFDDYDSFEKLLRKREQTLGEKWVKDTCCRTVERANLRIENTERHFKEKFQYAFLTMICDKGGKVKRSRGLMMRNRRSKKLGCPAVIRLTADRKKDKLVVKNCHLQHNHELNKFQNLPVDERLIECVEVTDEITSVFMENEMTPSSTKFVVPRADGNLLYRKLQNQRRRRQQPAPHTKRIKLHGSPTSLRLPPPGKSLLENKQQNQTLGSKESPLYIDYITLKDSLNSENGATISEGIEFSKNENVLKTDSHSNSQIVHLSGLPSSSSPYSQIQVFIEDPHTKVLSPEKGDTFAEEGNNDDVGEDGGDNGGNLEMNSVQNVKVEMEQIGLSRDSAINLVENKFRNLVKNSIDSKIRFSKHFNYGMTVVERLESLDKKAAFIARKEIDDILFRYMLELEVVE